MFDFPFAYSRVMETVLFFFSSATGMMFLYLSSTLVMRIYHERVSVMRRLLFSLCCHLGFYALPLYVVYFLTGTLSPLMMAIFSAPSPLFAYAYFFLGSLVFGYPLYRSLHLMQLAYLYMLTSFAINKLVSAVFFAQPSGGPYNYALDAAAILASGVIHALIYLLLVRPNTSTRYLARFTNSPPIGSLKRALFRSAIPVFLAYSVFVQVPLLTDSHWLAYAEVLLIELCAISFCLLAHYYFTLRRELEIRDVCLRSLNDAVNEFAGLRHDFNNILQTYGGYLSLGELEQLKSYHHELCAVTSFSGDKLNLNQKAAQNPALASVLFAKVEQAAQADVTLTLNLACRIDDLDVDCDSFCFAVGLLLDRALEAAQGSQPPHVTLSCEETPLGSKLMFITASHDTGTVTTAGGKKRKNPPQADAYHEARRYLRRCRNVFFHVSDQGGEFGAYIEITNAQPAGAG